MKKATNKRLTKEAKSIYNSIIYCETYTSKRACADRYGKHNTHTTTKRQDNARQLFKDLFKRYAIAQDNKSDAIKLYFVSDKNDLYRSCVAIEQNKNNIKRYYFYKKVCD